MPESANHANVGVVGAGIAGLTAARALQKHGLEVVLFDKARGVGGRTSIRRRGQFSFDHGAQYFSARHSRFQRQVEEWMDAGIAAEWKGRIVKIEQNEIAKSDATSRYVGVPGMNALARNLASGLQIILEKRIGRLDPCGAGWTLINDSGDATCRCDVLLLALPARQAAELLSTANRADQHMEQCRMEPCWAVLLGFDDALDVPFDGAFVHDSPLSWIARNSSKPGRAPAESWVLHAQPQWSAEHFDRSPEEVIDALWSEFKRVPGFDGPEPALRDSHRWRYALPASPLDQGCIGGAEQRWVACGDWCNGARLEGAFLSGLAAADELLRTTTGSEK